MSGDTCHVSWYSNSDNQGEISDTIWVVATLVLAVAESKWFLHDGVVVDV